MYLSRTCPTCVAMEHETLEHLDPALGFRIKRTYTDTVRTEGTVFLEPHLRTVVTRVPTTFVWDYDPTTRASTIVGDGPRVGMMTIQEVAEALGGSAGSTAAAANDGEDTFSPESLNALSMASSFQDSDASDASSDDVSDASADVSDGPEA